MWIWWTSLKSVNQYVLKLNNNKEQCGRSPYRTGSLLQVCRKSNTLLEVNFLVNYCKIVTSCNLAANDMDSHVSRSHINDIMNNMNISVWLLAFQESFTIFGLLKTVNLYYALKKCRLCFGQNQIRHFDSFFKQKLYIVAVKCIHTSIFKRSTLF